MVQEGTLVEMQLEVAVQESHVVPAGYGPVFFLQEPVLAVDDRVAGQHLYGLHPRPVHGGVFRRGEGEQLRQAYLEADGHVRILGEDASPFDREDWKLTFQCCRFQDVSHDCFV